jgi:DNA-binding PadR family transcriptional regulator
LSRGALTSFSYAVLTLVGRNGAGPHDLVRMAHRGRIYWDAADSQWYAEPKRLRALGLLDARKEPGRTRPRTHYTLTEKGVEALREWMKTPAQFPRIQHEAVCRLLAADLVGEEAVLESLEALRGEIADINERLDAAESIATTFSSRSDYLLLNHRLARRIVDAHTAWLDDIERELGSPKRRRRRSG